MTGISPTGRSSGSNIGVYRCFKPAKMPRRLEDLVMFPVQSKLRGLVLIKSNERSGTDSL